jgi:TolB protein
MRLMLVICAIFSMHVELLLNVPLANTSTIFSSKDSKGRSCDYLMMAGLTTGYWNIFMFDLESGLNHAITNGSEDDQMPAISPDMQTIAFTSRRADNWDIYTLDLVTGKTRRLTDSPTYDGWPTWSPDGKQIAFESYRDGSLNIYMMAAEGGTPVHITEGTSGKIEPMWAAQGNQMVYTAWESSIRQLYKLDLATHNVTRLTEPTEDPQQAALSPDGRWIAYINTADDNTLTIRSLIDSTIRHVPNVRNTEWPTWMPNTGGSALPDLLALAPMGGGAYNYPTGWSIASVQSTTSTRPFPPVTLPGQWQRPTCLTADRIRVPDQWQPAPAIQLSNPEFPPGLASLNGVRALQPRLAAAVTPSYQRLRNSVLKATGYDFLDALNDAWRGIDHPLAKYLSWHKTGRAIDVRDWFAPDGQNIVEIVRQNLDGKTYFRMYLRTARQDGSQGVPFRSMIWTAVGRRNDSETALRGGRELTPPEGYYVDFTDLAAREGWTRVPALTPPDGDWRQNDLDLEFWHYEHRDQLSWYAAMQLVYRQEALQQRYTPDQIFARGYTREAILHAGIPGGAQLLRSTRCSSRWVQKECLSNW